MVLDNEVVNDGWLEPISLDDLGLHVALSNVCFRGCCLAAGVPIQIA